MARVILVASALRVTFPKVVLSTSSMLLPDKICSAASFLTSKVPGVALRAPRLMTTRKVIIKTTRPGRR